MPEANELPRLFTLAEHWQPTDQGEPIRSVVTESADAVIVAWHVAAGQCIAAHVHPAGQDSWTVLSGHGDYLLNEAGQTAPIHAGQVVVARRGQVHGVLNPGPEPLIFVSVVSPASAGYEALGS